MTSRTEAVVKHPLAALGPATGNEIFYLSAKRSFQNVFCLVFFYIVWIMQNSCQYSYLKCSSYLRINKKIIFVIKVFFHCELVLHFIQKFDKISNSCPLLFPITAHLVMMPSSLLE